LSSSITTINTNVTSLSSSVSSSVSIYAKCNRDDRMNLFGYVDRHYRIDLTDETLGYDPGSGGQ
jgi:hypothetical protein